MEQKVDRIILGRLPFKDMLVCAKLVWSVPTSENQTVVAMELLHGRYDLFKHQLQGVAELRGLIFHCERPHFFLLGKLFKHSCVRLQDVLFEIAKSLVQWSI